MNVLLALVILTWLVGAFYFLTGAWSDGSLYDDFTWAAIVALLWPVIVLPWREWLPSHKPGKHSLIRSFSPEAKA